MRNWYCHFDPVGTMGNVLFLLPRMTEWQAGVKAQKIASAYDQAHVTLRAIHKRKKETETW